MKRTTTPMLFLFSLIAVASLVWGAPWGSNRGLVQTRSSGPSFDSGFVVADRAMEPLFTRVEFQWDAICPLDQTKDTTLLLRSSFGVLNGVQENISAFVHGMVPNWDMKAGTTMRFSGDCTHIIGDGKTLIIGN